MLDGIVQPWDVCLSADGIPTLSCIFVAFNNVINAAIVLSGIVALFFMMWAGYKFIMSQGDAEAISTARQTFLYAVIGIFFVIFAFVIFNFVLQDLFGLSSKEWLNPQNPANEESPDASVGI